MAKDNFIDKEIESVRPWVEKPRRESDEKLYDIKKMIVNEIWDRQKPEIYSLLKRLIEEIKKEMPEEKDESGDWSKKGYNEEMRVQGFNSCLEEVLKVLEKLETNPIN